MAQAKKLQVFVSSTYTDLQDERQAAVQAILTAGHIPAGMELFAAGDESQMQVIRRWIDESDVFLLILGGRYGSIEPKSGKSYIHLEYEYALDQGKPLFAVVITEEHLERKSQEQGLDVVEREHTQELKAFRESVLSRMVSFWDDPLKIELAVHRKLADLNRRDDLVGWVRGDQAIDTGPMATQLARLAEENEKLREQLDELNASEKYSGLTFQQLHDYLKATPVDPHASISAAGTPARPAAELLRIEEPTLLDLLWLWRGPLSAQMYHRDDDYSYCTLLLQVGLVEMTDMGQAFLLTDSGRRFLVRLIAEGGPGGA